MLFWEKRIISSWWCPNKTEFDSWKSEFNSGKTEYHSHISEFDFWKTEYHSDKSEFNSWKTEHNSDISEYCSGKREYFIMMMSQENRIWFWKTRIQFWKNWMSFCKSRILFCITKILQKQNLKSEFRANSDLSEEKNWCSEKTEDFELVNFLKKSHTGRPCLHCYFLDFGDKLT